MYKKYFFLIKNSGCENKYCTCRACGAVRNTIRNKNLNEYHNNKIRKIS